MTQKTVTNGWVNFGNLVKTDARGDKPAGMAIKLRKGVTLEITAEEFIDGEKVLVKRKLVGGVKGKEYLNVTEARKAANTRLRNSPDRLANQLEFLAKYPNIKSEITIGPDRTAEYDNSIDEDYY